MAALIAATTGEAVVHEKTISKTIGQSSVGTVSRLSDSPLTVSYPDYSERKSNMAELKSQL